MKADIRDMPAMKEAVERAVKDFGKLDIAVANAAIQIYGSLAEMSDDNWKNVIDVNLTGTANTLRAVIPHMLSNKSGRIVIIASGQGRHGFKNGSAYSASKWGVIGLMKSAAWEVGKDGITVNCVEPGLTDRVNALTWCPPATSARTRGIPIAPDPPATKTFMTRSFPARRALRRRPRALR